MLAGTCQVRVSAKQGQKKPQSQKPPEENASVAQTSPRE